MMPSITKKPSILYTKHKNPTTWTFLEHRTQSSGNIKKQKRTPFGVLFVFFYLFSFASRLAITLLYVTA